MANPTDNQTQSDQKSHSKPAKNYSVNIAGDIAPDGIDIEPNEKQANEKPANETDATRESLESATGQSTPGQVAGKKLVNPIWPVYE